MNDLHSQLATPLNMYLLLLTQTEKLSEHLHWELQHQNKVEHHHRSNKIIQKLLPILENIL